MNKIKWFILACAFFSLLVLKVNAPEETFTIAAGTSRTFPLSLNQGDLVTGALLSISGGSGNDVDFWVENPDGENFLNYGRVSGSASFEFTASQTGVYQLHISNSFSIFSTKTVTLRYDIQRTMFTPLVLQIIIIVIIIAIVAVVGFIVYKVVKRQQTSSRPRPSTSAE